MLKINLLKPSKVKSNRKLKAIRSMQKFYKKNQLKLKASAKY